jgi:hypothetical protein
MNSDAPTDTERKIIRTILADNVQTLDNRIRTSRSEEMSTDAERFHLKRLQTLAQLYRQYRLLARDDDVDVMETKLEALDSTLDQVDKG